MSGSAPPSSPAAAIPGCRAARGSRPAVSLSCRVPLLSRPFSVASRSCRVVTGRSPPKSAPVCPVLPATTAGWPRLQHESPKLLSSFTFRVDGTAAPGRRILFGTRPSPYPRPNRHCDSSSPSTSRRSRVRRVVSRETCTFRFHVKRWVSRETRFVGDVVALLWKADGILSRNEEREWAGNGRQPSPAHSTFRVRASVTAPRLTPPPVGPKR